MKLEVDHEPSGACRCHELYGMPMSFTHDIYRQMKVVECRTNAGAREYRIYLTLFESDRLPASWVQQLNAQANEVWTTSKWLALAFRASGHLSFGYKGMHLRHLSMSPPCNILPSKPPLKWAPECVCVWVCLCVCIFVCVRIRTGLHVAIKVVPIGTVPPSLSPPWHLSTRAQAFTFLVLANLQARKGVVETAVAFVAAFGPNNASVALRIHAKWADEKMMQDMESFRHLSNIHVSIDRMGEERLHDLWRQADCVVSLSKGEGWGLIPREALSIGLPVVVSELPCWETLRSHSSQVGGKGRAYFVRTAGREVASYGFTTEDTGHFFRVDEEHAREVLIQVFDDHAFRPGTSFCTACTHHITHIYTQQDLQVCEYI